MSIFMCVNVVVDLTESGANAREMLSKSQNGFDATRNDTVLKMSPV